MPSYHSNTELLLEVLKKYRDVFTWTYVEMSELGVHLVTYQLNIKNQANQTDGKEL